MMSLAEARASAVEALVKRAWEYKAAKAVGAGGEAKKENTHGRVCASRGAA